MSEDMKTVGTEGAKGDSPKGAKRRIVTFDCDGCERTYHVPDQYAGRTVRCKKCDAFTIIPIPGGPAPDLEDSDVISIP